jgi:L-threonylcarbamoyladenylate synthase
MTQQTAPSDNDVKSASAIIRSGGVVIYPTETVYGLAVYAYDSDAIMKVLALKKRSSNKPISIAVSDYHMLQEVAHLDDTSRTFINKFLPGPVTVILPKKAQVPDILTGGSGLIGIRWPDHPLTIQLIESVGAPITSTSANTSGKAAPAKLADIEEEILLHVDYVIEGQECRYSEPSTVVDLVNRKILRIGALHDTIMQTLEELE